MDSSSIENKSTNVIENMTEKNKEKNNSPIVKVIFILVIIAIIFFTLYPYFSYFNSLKNIVSLSR